MCRSLESVSAPFKRQLLLLTSVVQTAFGQSSKLHSGSTRLTVVPPGHSRVSKGHCPLGQVINSQSSRGSRTTNDPSGQGATSVGHAAAGQSWKLNQAGEQSEKGVSISIPRQIHQMQNFYSMDFTYLQSGGIRPTMVPSGH